MASQKDISERIKGLILIAPAVYFTGSKFGKFLLSFSLFRTAAEKIMKANYLNRESFDNLLESAYGRKPEPEETEGYLTPLLSPNSEKAFFDALLNSDDQASPNFTEAEKPVLIIHGQNDSWIKLENSEKLNREIKGSRLHIIQNAGHCPMETHPDSVNQFILNFINSPYALRM